MHNSDSRERHKFWADVMEQYDRSGLTRKAFCEQNNLSFNKFLNWRLRISQKHKANQQIPFDGKFIPLVVTDQSILKEVTPVHTLDLKLDPSGNISLSIPSQFNLEYLSSLLTVIRRIAC